MVTDFIKVSTDIDMTTILRKIMSHTQYKQPGLLYGSFCCEQ